MKYLQNRVILMSSLGFTLVLYGLNVRRNRQQAHYAEEPHGRFTAQQILKRADWLNALLSPDGEQYNCVADYSESVRPGRSQCCMWSVLCTSKTGNRDRFFIWDANSGQLITVGCKNPPNSTPGNILTPMQAADRARNWVQCLGMVENREHCHLIVPPRGMPTGWCIEMTAGQKRLLVHMNRVDGSLFSARVW